MPDASPNRATIHCRVLMAVMFMSKALRDWHWLAAADEGKTRAFRQLSNGGDFGPGW